MFHKSTPYRIKTLTRILCSNKIVRNNTRAFISTESVSIGHITRDIKEVQNEEYVPRNYYSNNENQSTIHHLQWMMQKDILGQDIFLLGPPGPSKRHLTMQYLELTNRELEYISLSRDTTESDLKQRREIVSGSATYFDQSAVRAATKGRILVLDGIEKAERNVLPVLNNLLENREMHLEDGRTLIPASRYDELLEMYGLEEMDKWKLVRVDENFRVIALGLPVPWYRGNPLDPPLRSRFQARDISMFSYQETVTMKDEARLRTQHNEHKYQKLSIRSHTIDTGHESRNSILAENYPIGTSILKSDEYYTSLSDRVLMWLDLATQNGSCSEAIASFKKLPIIKSRVVTAGATIVPPRRGYSKAFDNYKIDNHIMYDLDRDESLDANLDDDYYFNDESFLKCSAVNLERDIGEEKDTFIVSDDNAKCINIKPYSDMTEFSNVNDKRQLHIFMPNFPRSFCDFDDISVMSKNSSMAQ
ncbi:hypothetical protein HHI36_017127 [Cryptolaemus montrouzieri]|uniref:ATPase dynein-related AAA domain-containing protein n=1 Tax=Cryptolaemus montrouzieri TaxID=559131 RepID=A0ABD2NLN6_9CUCU